MPEELNQRLSRISTIWTVLRQAHDGPGTGASAAHLLLLQRYGGAVRRYLLAAVKDADEAEELTQEFALSLVRGEFRGADPQRGRFRDYVKAVLFHLVSRHRKRQQKEPRPLPADSPELAALTAPPEDLDRRFDEGWSDELLARVWQVLGADQPVFYAVLRFRAEHPEMRSHQMAEHLGRQLGRPLTSDGVRQTLRRAREKFADLLIDEVAHSLEAPTVEQVEEELQELGLLEYCRPALVLRRAADA